MSLMDAMEDAVREALALDPDMHSNAWNGYSKGNWIQKIVVC